MAFARTVWKVLVAVKDGLALVLLLLFFVALYAALAARPGTASVVPGALLLNLDGAIVEERANQNPLNALLAQQAPVREYAAYDIIRALRLAAHDDRIKVVVLDLSRFTGGGQVHITDIGAALDAVRAAGKPVLTYATLYSDDSIQLAAHASEVWVDPLGGAMPTGPGHGFLFYGPLLDRLKVTVHVFRVGTYKSAVEPYVRGGFSPEAKADLRGIYEALWSDWRADVARARPRANIALATGDAAGWLRAAGGDGAKAALTAGLVDRVGDPVAFGTRVAQLAGQSRTSDRPGSFASTSLDTWLAANPAATAGRAIGVITIAGDIVPGDAGPGTAGGERIARLLDDGLDDNLAALVVRIDSPGGAITAGEQIRAAIARYRARGIPVVVSMANVAASGGYWVSTPANRIFAEPATITGSIGVFGIVPTFERALAQYGVTSDGYRTTPLSGQPDVFAGLSPELSDILQTTVDFSYARFLDLVAHARGKTPAQVDAIAQGRVWDGGTARQIGLVDQFGGLDDALAYAARAARLDGSGWHAQFLVDQPPAYAGLIAALMPAPDDGDDAAQGSDWAAIATRRNAMMIGQAIAGLDRLVATPGLQAYCIECAAAGGGPPRSQAHVSAAALLMRGAPGGLGR